MALLQSLRRTMSNITASAICIAALLLPAQSNSALLRLHNSERAAKSVEPLELDHNLCEYAQKHAESMARRGQLVHSSMSNLSVNAGNGNVAENIAWGQDSEEEVVWSWMNSSGHRQNIMAKRFKKVGFGSNKDDRGRTYWCAVFSA